MIWAVVAVWIYVLAMTLWRREFKYPFFKHPFTYTVTPSGDPLGYWTTVVFLAATSAIIVWLALQ